MSGSTLNEIRERLMEARVRWPLCRESFYVSDRGGGYIRATLGTLPDQEAVGRLL